MRHGRSGAQKIYAGTRGPQIIFRDKMGRFLPYADRYKPSVAMIQARRGRDKEYVVLAERSLSPEDLPQVLNQREFELLPEALVGFKTFTSDKKYKAWDIAEQIDRTKSVRRKDLKYTVTIDDGGRQKKVSFYHRIKANSPSSYSIFRRINQEIGMEGFYLYKQAGGKMVADRKGKQVKLVNIHVEKVL